jgi:hypothetical protein
MDHQQPPIDERAGPLIPQDPSALERIYVAFGITAAEREARYGQAIGEQGHHLEMAKAMADGALVDAFIASVEACAGYANEGEPFFDPRDALTRQHHPASDEDLRTSSIAWWLEQQDPVLRDADRGAQGWTYVARELVPLRTSGQDANTSALSRASRRLDLLLADQERTPALTEVKARGDQHPFYATIQVLLLAAQLASPSQRSRLAAHHQLKPDGPVDLCLILAANARYFFEPEEGWNRAPKFKPKLTVEAERLSAAFVADPRTHAHVRSITWLEARMVDAKLAFAERRRFEQGERKAVIEVPSP